jgi:hypothetical protein
MIHIDIQKFGYLPDLSFGTHFFQDLVESSIRYLPLYPDEPLVVFKEEFFSGSPSVFTELAPELCQLAEVVRVIDVPRATGGLVVRILMNGEAEEAVGFLTAPAAGRAG